MSFSDRTWRERQEKDGPKPTQDKLCVEQWHAKAKFCSGYDHLISGMTTFTILNSHLKKSKGKKMVLLWVNCFF